MGPQARHFSFTEPHFLVCKVKKIRSVLPTLQDNSGEQINKASLKRKVHNKKVRLFYENIITDEGRRGMSQK